MKTCNGGRNVVINTKVTIVRETNNKTEHFIQIGYCYLLKSGPLSSRRRKNSVLNLYFRPEYIGTQIKYVCCYCFLFNIWLIARPRYHEKKKQRKASWEQCKTRTTKHNERPARARRKSAGTWFMPSANFNLWQLVYCLRFRLHGRRKNDY